MAVGFVYNEGFDTSLLTTEFIYQLVPYYLSAVQYGYSRVLPISVLAVKIGKTRAFPTSELVEICPNLESVVGIGKRNFLYSFMWGMSHLVIYTECGILQRNPTANSKSY